MATLIQKSGTVKWYVKMMYKGKHYERATGESDKRKVFGKKSEVIAQIKAEADARSSSQIKISNAWDAWLLAPKRLEPSPQTLFGKRPQSPLTQAKDFRPTWPEESLWTTQQDNPGARA